MSLANKRVLVIEDNDDNMKLITFILEKNGCVTIRAGSGSKGIELALKDSPDFVLLDINLPDMDGLEVLKEIRRLSPDVHLPIIAITSYAMSGDRERLLAGGCTGYLEKPIDPVNIITQLKRIILERHDESFDCRGR